MLWQKKRKKVEKSRLKIDRRYKDEIEENYKSRGNNDKDNKIMIK